MKYIENNNIYLTRLSAEHQSDFINSAVDSQKIHVPFVSPPSNEVEFQNYVKKNDFERNFNLVALHKKENSLIGIVSLNEVVRGAFQNAFLGYYVFKPFQGQGLMRQSLQLIETYAKDELKLHRLEANIQPDNKRSILLVQSIGFVKEGYSKNYLKINDRWCDHERWAKIL